MEQDNACRGIRATSEERIKRLKRILHSLATRVPVVKLKRVEKQYPSLEYSMTVSVTSSIVNDSRHPDAKQIPENSLRIRCKKCQKTFIHRDFYNSHDCKNFDCKICFKSFPFNSYLKRHILTHNSINHSAVNSPHIKCQKCQQTFIHRDFYDSHECRNFICKICNILFRSSIYLKRHMSSHKEEPYKCHLCSRSFKRPCELSLHCRSGHMININKSDGKIMISRLDGKRKTRRLNDRRNVSRSDDEKTLCCDICDRRFLKLMHLMNHKRVHYKQSKHHSAANSFTRRNTKVHEGSRERDEKNHENEEVYGKSTENGEDKCNSEEKDQILENKFEQNGSYEKDLNEFVEEEMEKNSEKGNEIIENGLEDNEIDVHESNPKVDEHFSRKNCGNDKVEDEEFSPSKILVETSQPHQLIQTNLEGKVNVEINCLSEEKSKEETEINRKLNLSLSNHHSQADEHLHAANLT